MTKLLLEAIEEAKQLPEWEQDALAAMILEEIADNQECLTTEVKSRNADLLVNLVESSLVMSVH
jgi:hypothetical protein